MCIYIHTYCHSSKLLQKQMITTKYNVQQVVKGVTAAVAASQATQQRHKDSDSEDDDEFGAASTYANYQPAKCVYIVVCV